MADTTLLKEIDNLTAAYGEEAVAKAITALTGKTVEAAPPAYLPIISANKLADTVAQLDAAASDIITKGKERESVYGDKLELVKRKRELETAIELRESEAIMSIRGEARSQYVMVGDEKVLLSNEEARKAFAKTSAKDERQQLAEVEAQLNQLEVQSFWKKDEYEAAVKAGSLVESKAAVQAGLLKLLGGK